MRPAFSGLVRWFVCLVVLIPICAAVLIARDDGGWNLGYYYPKYATEGMHVYGVWAGLANVATMAGVPIALFVLLRHVLMPTRALKILVGGVLGLLAALVVAIEVLLSQDQAIFVTDFTLFPDEAVAAMDEAALQARTAVLKAKDKAQMCDEAFLFHDVTAKHDPATASRLREEYSFDRQIVVSGKPVDIDASITLEQLLYAVDAEAHCMARYEERANGFFQNGEFAQAAKYFGVAAKLAIDGSDDKSRLQTMLETMDAVLASDQQATAVSE